MGQHPGHTPLPGVGKGREGGDSPLDILHYQVYVRKAPGPLETLWRRCRGPRTRWAGGSVTLCHLTGFILRGPHFRLEHFLSQLLSDKVVSSCHHPDLLQPLMVPEDSILTFITPGPVSCFCWRSPDSHTLLHSVQGMDGSGSHAGTTAQTQPLSLVALWAGPLVATKGPWQKEKRLGVRDT